MADMRVDYTVELECECGYIDPFIYGDTEEEAMLHAVASAKEHLEQHGFTRLEVSLRPVVKVSRDL